MLASDPAQDPGCDDMEFLVEFDLEVPDGASESEVNARYTAEAAASAELAPEEHLVRLWRSPVTPGERKAVGLYRADGQEQLDGLLRPLALHAWMDVTRQPCRDRSQRSRRGAGQPGVTDGLPGRGQRKREE